MRSAHVQDSRVEMQLAGLETFRSKHCEARFPKYFRHSLAFYSFFLLFLPIPQYCCYQLVRSDLLSLSDETNVAFFEMLQSHETSVKDYHDRNRVRESYSSIACEMGTGRTDKLVITVSTKRFEIWHTEVKWRGQLAFNRPRVRRWHCEATWKVLNQTTEAWNVCVPIKPKSDVIWSVLERTYSWTTWSCCTCPGRPRTLHVQTVRTAGWHCAWPWTGLSLPPESTATEHAFINMLETQKQSWK